MIADDYAAIAAAYARLFGEPPAEDEVFEDDCNVQLIFDLTDDEIRDLLAA